MDLSKFEKGPINSPHNCASREKVNALLNEYQKEYHSKSANRKKSQEILIVEPKFKRRRRNKLNIAIKCLAHGLYYCNGLNLLPCDTGIFLNVPPWKYEHPKPKLNLEEFLIEPDWNSY